MKVSFCLITRDEEENLPRCLASVASLADEIVVLDSGSTDRTEAIALAAGARFFRREWPGYVEQKNRAVALASHEWVFSIDADEELSPRLRDEVAAVKAGPVAGSVSGFSVPRCVRYEGRWIRHGDWYPDRLVRLFRRDRARFAGGKVHERLEITGEVRRLSGDLHHHSFRDAADHQARCERYARLWAETRLAEGKSGSTLAPHGHAAFRWLRCYVLRRGFLDGPQGWRIARLVAREAFLKHTLLGRLGRET